MSKRIQKQHEEVDSVARSGGCGVEGPIPYDPLRGAAQPALGISSGAGASSAAFAKAGQAGTWLRPGVVVAVEADALTIDAADRGCVAARMAMPVPYSAAIGDELLVLGEGERAYVVGVLRGAGATRLELEGDVEISASGKLGLRAGAGVTIDAPEVQLRTSKMSVLAGRVTQVYDTLRTTVRELMQVRAGEQQTLVDGTSHLQAKNARMLSESKVTINGKEIFLG